MTTWQYTIDDDVEVELVADGGLVLLRYEGHEVPVNIEAINDLIDALRRLQRTSKDMAQ